MGTEGAEGESQEELCVGGGGHALARPQGGRLSNGQQRGRF